MRRTSFLALTLMLGLMWHVAADAQSFQRRVLDISGNSNAVERSCSFRVRADLGNSATRRGFQLRLPNWSLSVAVLAGSGITTAAVDATLNSAADLLKVDQGGADANCCIDLTRTGAVNNFTPPASMVGGVISNQAESDAVFAINADIKVVNSISFCGMAGTYAGCADGNSIIVVNSLGGLANANWFTDPATVAHEVGHWSGLGHVAQTCVPTRGQCGTCAGNCTDGFSNSVMYCAICNGAPTQGIVSGSECTSYQGAAQ